MRPRLPHRLLPLVLLLVAMSVLAGCAAGGPAAAERAPGEFGVAVRNDRDDAVQVQLCERWSDDRNCRSFFEDDPPSQEVAPGKRATVLVHAETERGKGNEVAGIIRIAELHTNEEVGCMPYDIATPPTDGDTLRFDASQAKPCDDDAPVDPTVVAPG